jgi:hypothetical protein
MNDSNINTDREIYARAAASVEETQAAPVVQPANDMAGHDACDEAVYAQQRD